jgi:pyruvate formate lyase activating enzyme
MLNGIIFDIKEFAIHDGPGIRTTVFMKGCPLTCMWCHNPESQSMQKQVIKSPTGERIAGREYSSRELATLLNKQAPILRENEGGVTFSGGEPLFQAEFVAEVIDSLEDLHVVIDTSGYGTQQDFQLLLERTDLFYFDLKLINRDAHLHYTAMDNDLILQNLHLLSVSGKPFIIRVPLVPRVTDTNENLSAIAATVKDMPGLLEVNLLPYNRAAGAKYENAGMHFHPEYDEKQTLNQNVSIFINAGLKVRCL